MKEEKGITLVALVVTIIILLILAGVGLAFTFGEDGIIQKSKQAVERHNQAVGNEEGSMNQVEGIMDEYLGGSSGGELTGYKDINLDVYIGQLYRQKASYLQLKVVLEEMDPSSNTVLSSMTAHVGYDGTFVVDKDDNHNFLPNTFSMELIQKTNPATRYSVVSTFSNVILTGKVKTGVDYRISFYRTVSRKSSDNTIITEENHLMGQVTIGKEENSKTISNSVRDYIDYNADGVGSGSDTSILAQVFTTLADKVISSDIDADGKAERFIPLMDEKGNIIEELKNYIGFDVNANGYIGDEDAYLVPLIVGGMNY